MSGQCRVCGDELPAPVYSAPAPSITSMATTVPLPLQVWVCGTCAHGQSSALPDLSGYYDSEYQISLASDEHDQLYDIVDGRELFRTEKQAQLVLEFVPPAEGARILDYGAAKAATLAKLCDLRPDLVPHVFDVSNSYAGHWARWLQKESCASYELPDSWKNSFDVVTAHFVLEHVADPLKMLHDLRAVVKSGGLLFLSVPNTLSNSGDFLVADHINHFSRSSLELAFRRAGFGLTVLNDTAYRGAFVAVGTALEGAAQTDFAPSQDTVAEEASALSRLGTFWTKATEHLAAEIEKRGSQKCAIYGAGFYGSFIAMRIGDNAEIQCFIDRNPHVRAQPHLGRPVVAPSELPEDVEIVYAGLNPASSRKILGDVAEWRGRRIDVVYLD